MNNTVQLWRIKICGVTSVHDARAVAAAGADAIGLNFFPGSKRYVDVQQAIEIVDTLPSGLQKVGVFVNAAADEIRKIRQQVPLDLVQLHGEEPPESLKHLEGQAIVRAFRCSATGLDPVVEYLQQCQELGSMPNFVLLDASEPGQYGGTGRTLDWSRLAPELARLRGVPWVLAGGLTADNVGRAIRQLRPAAVDTASGVEVEPGRKDPQLLQAFVRAAEQAWADPDR
jgi:phosphoribosylanthranilate isomerase